MQLLKVQKAALKAGEGRPGFAYYMQMGLGKTLVSLSEFIELTKDKKATRLVVVCPNSFKGGWQDEIKKHGINVDTHIFNSGADYENTKFLTKKYDKPPVLIINYEAIRKEAVQEYVMKFVYGRNAMLVLDESVQIKTHDSLQTKAALKIAAVFKYRRILSGKPVTSGPHDLWAQMRIVGAVTSKFWPFKSTFCRMGGFKGKKVVGSQNEELLADTIERFIFRASKKDWTDLPPKVYTSRQYSLTPSLIAKYQSMENDFVVWLTATENVSIDAFITKMIKLAQIQSGFIIKEDETVEELVPPDQNPRFQLVRQIIEDEIEGKVVIPYVHKYTFKLLSTILAEYNPAYIVGGMKSDEITAQKDKFNNDDTCRVILGQMRASKYGFTLLGGSGINSCSTMLFAENSYSLDDRSQVEDRIHRHGQVAESCLYIDLWGTPLDKRVTAALQAKEDMAKAVFQFFGRG